MPQRDTSSQLTCIGLLCAFALLVHVTAGGSASADDAAKGALVLAALASAYVLLQVDPAWPLSLGLAATIFSGHWADAGSPIPLDRLLIGLGLLSLFLRARSVRDIFGAQPSGIHWLLLAASAYALSSAVISGTISDHNATFGLLDRYGFVPFALFAVAPVAFGTEAQRRVLLWVLTIVGAYLAYTSILGHLGPRSLVHPAYITNPAIGIHADRARGPFVDAGGDGLGLFECAVAATILAWGLTDRRLRLLAVGVAVACALSIELTLTRSVWIGSGLALAVTLVAVREARRYLVPITAATLALVFGALAVIPGLSGQVSSRENDKAPIWDRRNANAAALRMVAARPLLGFGWFTFKSDGLNYIRNGADYPVTRGDIEEHNVFLSNALELGLPGALLWASALVVGIGGAIVRRGPPELRRWRIGLTAVAVQWFVVANFVPLGYAFPNAILWLMAGIVSGPALVALGQRRDSRSRSALAPA